MENKIKYLKVEDKNQIPEIVDQAKKFKKERFISIIFIKTELSDDEILELESTNVPILMLGKGVSYDVFDELVENLESATTDGLINLDIHDIGKIFEEIKYLGVKKIDSSADKKEVDNKAFSEISQKSLEKPTKILFLFEITEDVELDVIDKVASNVIGGNDVYALFSARISEQGTNRIRGFAITD